MGHGRSDNPEHTVTLSDFWIYQAKVTNQQYALCVQAGKCKAPDPIDDFTFKDATHANDPVVGLNYSQGTDYCSFVHGRLPTEAEWEKTARGPQGNLYPWGSNAPICDLLNFNNCVKKITDVTTYQKGQSYYHALDMEGNVFEWVGNWYNALYYKNGAAQDPLGPDAGQQRSVRSSSYKSKSDEIPASTRRYDFPNDHRREPRLPLRCRRPHLLRLCLPESIGLIGVPPPGGSTGGTLTTDCPKVGIGLTAVCQQGKVTVVVGDNHSPDLNAVVSGVGACTPVIVAPSVFPQVYDCTSDTTVNITTVCNYVVTTPATCAAHYILNTITGMCDWDGTGSLGGQCLPGQNFDTARQCCSAQPGTASDYPICPLGTTLGSVLGKPVCVPNNQALNKPSQTEFVHVQDPATCTGGSVGACTLTDASCKKSCRYGGVLIPSACACACNPG